MNPIFTVRRYATGDSGTFGDATLTEIDGTETWRAFSLEEQWKDNAPNVSCIPAGRYVAEWTQTPKHPNGVYMLHNVPGRNAIEIHVGNTENDILGCILVGERLGVLKVDDDEETPEVGDAAIKGAVLASREAYEGLLRAAKPPRPILCVIEWQPGVGEREGEA